MHDIVSSGRRFSDHFDGKPATDQVVAGWEVNFRVATTRILALFLEPMIGRSVLD